MAIFREEQDGKAGLKQSQQRTKAEFPLVLDKDSVQTRAYSQESFNTYVIGRQGRIQAMLKGTKTKRPDAKQILSALAELKPDGSAQP